MKIKIIIADDHRMVREGIKQLLELDGEIEVIGEADNGVQCMKLIKKLKPDVTLLDINMPEKNGLEVLEEIKKVNYQEKIVLLTIHNEIEYLMRAKEIGIDGYVLKDSDSTILKKAISTVYNGGTYIEPQLFDKLKEKLSKSYSEEIKSSLTKREMDVLKLIAEGLYNKEIAYKLHISEKTVKNHISSIFKKIGVSDRTQAAVYAIRKNIV